MIFGNLRLVVENYVKVPWFPVVLGLMEVRISIADSPFWSPDYRFQNKFGVVHYDTCTSIRVAVD